MGYFVISFFVKVRKQINTKQLWNLKTITHHPLLSWKAS